MRAQMQRLQPLRQLVMDLCRRSPARFAYVLALMVLTSLSSGIGILLIVPLLGSVGISLGDSVTGAGIQNHINSAFAALGLTPSLELILLLYLGLIVGVALLNYLNSVSGAKLQRDFVVELRGRLYRNLLGANWQYLSRERMSDFARLVTGQVQSTGFTLFQILSLASKLVLILVYLGLSLWLSPLMTLLALACAAILVALMLPLNHRIHRSGRQELAAHSDIFHAVFEQLYSLKIIKSFSAEAMFAERMDSANRQLENQQVRMTRFHALSRFVFLAGAAAIFSLLFFVAIRLIQLPVANLILILFVFSRLMPQLSSIQALGQQLIHAAPEYLNLLEHCRELEAQQEPGAGPGTAPAFEREIRLENLGFQYPGKRAPVFHGLSARIAHNDSLALVGPSGTGKSTLADIVAGLLAPGEGRMLVDGVEIGDHIRLRWRTQVAYVTQEVFLFNDSVRANLEWVCDRPLSDAELWHYLRLAAADFVENLPEQLDTLIGDRGTQLSGGERQRLALARALIAQPQLLILDEATSALDRDNEQRIREALDNLRGKLTILIIAHNEETIAAIDKRIDLREFQS